MVLSQRPTSGVVSEDQIGPAVDPEALGAARREGPDVLVEDEATERLLPPVNLALRLRGQIVAAVVRHRQKVLREVKL